MFRRTIAGVAAGAALAAPLALAAPAQAAGIGDGNPYDYDIVTAAIAATGTALPSTFTAFFPNDRAFEVLAKSQGALPADHRFRSKVDEQAVFDGLVAKLTVPTIAKVLQYHVIPGVKLTSTDVRQGPRVIKDVPTALAGQTLDVYSFSRTKPIIFVGDEDGRFFNDFVVRPDVLNPSATSIVHGITDVLLPTL
jgi:hypothetical protein